MLFRPTYWLADTQPYLYLLYLCQYALIYKLLYIYIYIFCVIEVYGSTVCIMEIFVSLISVSTASPKRSGPRGRALVWGSGFHMHSPTCLTIWWRMTHLTISTLHTHICGPVPVVFAPLISQTWFRLCNEGDWSSSPSCPNNKPSLMAT